MPSYRLGQAARLLGVSVDTVRRHVDRGELVATRSPGGHRLVDGRDLARFVEALDRQADAEGSSSARNHLLGIVTRVVKDRVAAQVELRCGPFRIVSLITAESVDALGIEPGMLMNAVVKATNVVVERAEVPVAGGPATPEGEELDP
jgi:molybdopterin-binding protein